MTQHQVPLSAPVSQGYHPIAPEREEYIAQATDSSILSLSIGGAVSEQERDNQGGADCNTLIDKFDLISALPYVDEIVSNDHFFHSVYPAALKTGMFQGRTRFSIPTSSMISRICGYPGTLLKRTRYPCCR